MANVLLLVLSNWHEKITNNHYRYDNGKEYFVEGYLTNEAPAKALIDYLADSQKRIDKIVMLASEATRRPIGNLNNIYTLPSGKQMKDMNTVEYYQNIIKDYCKTRHEGLYRDQPISFISIETENEPDEAQITEAIIKCSDKVIAEETTHVYIDYNGGQRFVAFMIVAIADMMKLRNVSIEQILAMEHKENMTTLIQNRKILFDNLDLIAGLNECVNYGRIKTLKKYFGNTEPQLFDELENFINDFQLCRIDEVMRNRTSLRERIKEYKDSIDQKTSFSATERMLDYVIRDIEREYYSLLNGEIPNILSWCVKKDFIQQGLTFCTERLPEYLWCKGILCPSPLESLAYEQYLKEPKEEKEEKFCREALRELNDIEKNQTIYVQRAYHWMTNYIPRNWEKVPKEIYKAGYGKQVNWLLERNKKRWSTSHKKPDKLTEIVNLFFLLKEQRNFTNHASETLNSTNSKPLGYKALREKMVRLTELLKV